MHRHHLLSLTIFIFVLSNLQLQGQRRTYSPASRFGLGEISTNATGQANGMGQTGIGISSSKYLNKLNPASYSAMDSLSFYFDAGLNGFSQKISDPLASSNFSNFVFDYFAIGFPISKNVATSIGISAFSKAGYNLQQTNVDPDHGSSSSQFNGSGNVSSVYWGLGVKPFKNASAGVHVSYLFGNLKHVSYIEYPDDLGALRYGRLSEMRVNDIYIDFGAQYNIDLDNGKRLILGATFAPKQNMHNKYSTFTAQGVNVNTDNDIIMTGDTIEYIPLGSKSFDMPLSYGLGVSYQIDDKLIVAADYKFEGWSKTRFPDAYTQTNDMTRYSAGAEFIPNDRNNRNYLLRIRYRAGAYYKNDYLKIMGNPTNEFGINFGLGLPLKRTRSSVNLGCDIGQKGNVDDNGYKEDYVRFTLSFTMHEYWFVKQKFD
ncbi:MAG: hypothetical protein QM786_16005 [Breznakibacter sp.]